MLNKIASIAATALSAFATLSVAPASFWFVYQSETPAELLSK